MINLLPPAHKRDIQAARANSLLIRYNFLLLSVLAFLMLSIGVVYVYLTNTKASAETTIRDNQAKVAGFTPVEEQAQSFRQNLSTAKQILDREVNYTQVILALAKVLPNGVVLTSLSLDAATFGTETTLAAKAKSYEQAIALKDALSQSSLFSDVHFQSIVASEGTDYPVTVNLYVTFKKEAAKS
jgi:Tfp pilus assembly protein PilN